MAPRKSMTIVTFALLVAFLQVEVQLCEAMETFALCEGYKGCRTMQNVRIHCASVDRAVWSMIAVRGDFEQGFVQIHRQWVVPPWTNYSHFTGGAEVVSQLSGIGTELRVEGDARCFPAPLAEAQLQMSSMRFHFVGEVCRFRIRRGAVRCRRPRHCGQNDPCAVPENPLASSLCEIDSSTCLECCPNEACKPFPCSGDRATSTEIRNDFGNAKEDCQKRSGKRSLCDKHRMILTDGDPNGLAYTSYDTTYVTNGNYVGLSTAIHDIAHSIRYLCDGSKEHYRRDAAKYNYLRAHDCRRKSSKEFSFNEGWAFFWAEDCTDNKESDEGVAGDVANSLRSLKRRCNSGYSSMVDTLCRNPGSIHSYGEFEMYHQRLHGCS